MKEKQCKTKGAARSHWWYQVSVSFLCVSTDVNIFSDHSSCGTTKVAGSCKYNLLWEGNKRKGVCSVLCKKRPGFSILTNPGAGIAEAPPHPSHGAYTSPPKVEGAKNGLPLGSHWCHSVDRLTRGETITQLTPSPAEVIYIMSAPGWAPSCPCLHREAQQAAVVGSPGKFKRKRKLRMLTFQLNSKQNMGLAEIAG